jgi:tetratricopeptide (TPR) repeat protein
MELSLVEIAPTPDSNAKPGTDLPELEFPAVDKAPLPAPTPAARLHAVEPRQAIPAPSPIVAEAAEAAAEIELVAFGAKRAMAASPEGADALAAEDPAMADALREYKNGNIDLPLWSRAIAQHEGDQPKAVAAYLQARATFLKLERRRRGTVSGLPGAAAAPAVRPKAWADEDEDIARAAQVPVHPWRKYAVMATPVVVALVVGGWWMWSTSNQDLPQARSAAASVAAPSAPAALVPPAPRPVRPTKEEDPSAYFAGKIQELKSASNWNVMVLYASEWTRKQPGNANAWKELSIGYSNMRQYNDALEAGTKATQLAPTEPTVWRNLAQVSLDLKDTEGALKAFERAATLDPGDIFSQLQVGALSAQLNLLPQARTAYEQVLAADPDNPDALCGTMAIAQKQGRGKDAEGMSRQLRGTDHKCREAPSVVAARK